jgi:predicted nucleic acid-binding protein
MSPNPVFIVIDTNVLISAGLLPQSTTVQALAVALTHSVFTQNQDT